jgi:hypothetical protein
MAGNMWIDCNADMITKWECTMNTYELLWEDVNPKSHDLKSFAQDAFTWATMFIWFVAFSALIYSGFMMITWWYDEKRYETWKRGVVFSLLWLLLVWFAYGIVRFIQFIARW